MNAAVAKWTNSSYEDNARSPQGIKIKDRVYAGKKERADLLSGEVDQTKEPPDMNQLAHYAPRCLRRKKSIPSAEGRSRTVDGSGTDATVMRTP